MSFIINSKLSYDFLIWISFLMILSGAGYYFYSKQVDQINLTGEATKEQTIAVLPFVNGSKDVVQDYLTDGLTEAILNSLAHLKGFKVSARNSSFKFRGKNIDVKEIGEKLAVRVLLMGSIHVKGDLVRITTQLVSVEDGTHFWTQQYDEKLNDVIALQNKISIDIANKLEFTILAGDQIEMSKKQVPDKEAYKLYLKARSFWSLRNPSDLKKSIEFFQQAINLDPSFAEAYSGLADSYTALGYGSHISPEDAFSNAWHAAKKAVRLDSSLAEPHASLGFLNFYYNWDWAAAEQEFRIALALNSSYASAYDWYAFYLTAMQRYDEAQTMLLKAESLDPLSVAIHTDMGFSSYYSGNYDNAILELQNAIKMNSRFALAHVWLARVYQQKKKYEEAIKEYQLVLEITPDWTVALAGLGNVYGISGNSEGAQNILKKLDSLSSKKFVTSYGTALVYAGLGDKDQVFVWLDKAYNERSNWLVWLKTDPRWAMIRGERKYNELVRKVGLPRY